MAQIVKLKRTAVSGKIPTISNLQLGELAMNTYDGRIFFEKNDGSATIQEILTTNAGRAITGSININGAITASYFKGFSQCIAIKTRSIRSKKDTKLDSRKKIRISAFSVNVNHLKFLLFLAVYFLQSLDIQTVFLCLEQITTGWP